MTEAEREEKIKDALDIVARIKHIVCNPKEHLHSDLQELAICCALGENQVQTLVQMHAIIREQSELGLELDLGEETPAFAN